MSRRCYRSLDKPFEVFLGLGPVELILIAVVALGLMTALSAPVGLFGGAAFGVLVRYFREGKPRGYLFYLAYRSGILGILPDGVRPPGLAPAGPFARGRVRRYSAVPGEADDESDESRHYWSGKKLLG
jgi:hypothetical protein